ncbi:MAG: mannose-1-phosphate guanylyltransferase/mannose-6-phosphate isomerase [Gammaproteobacteria bacterium]|jgi:mannose-1-phosphate guanylyltransferase/mannose-6-phosphate isomerase|nr:mannose-1-phosphate guanylyltransferase/mannose-6-phosphate isomerase [Gammaproteobacteria bacterium]
MKLYPVILSGGSGSRLWPLSREYYPKPLLPLVADKTLLQQTACRLDSLPDIGDAVYVCNEEHRFLVAEQITQLGKTPATIILEPTGRNTAPALTLAALYLVRQDPDAMMVVMPADHVMTEPLQFVAAIAQGSGNAEEGALVTFGIVPESPETGYGYIKRDTQLEGGSAYSVAQFVEKPDKETAEQYINEGDYYWNSGIFLMRADRWLDEISQYHPDILRSCREAMNAGVQDRDFFRINKQKFHQCPSDSIDYAVMEKTKRAVVVPISAGWSDIGAWSALWDICPHDEDGNVIQGDVLVEDTHNAFLVAQHRCLATVGLDNVVVVETADAVLVASMDKAQDVKAIVSRLKGSGREECKVHRQVYRPWGSYEGIDAGSRFQVKRLSVKPGAQLSLQLHHHRAEHWVVVKGTARVTCGEQVFVLHENESTYIPIGETHRLENPGNIPLEVIEIQSGSYLGEDDIIRFEDVYDRVQEK